MIEETGTITAVDQDHIWVETEIKSTCGSCQVNDNCGTGVVARAFAPKKERLILRCKEQARVGQKVTLGIPEQKLVQASMLVYLLPLFSLVASAVIAQIALPQLGFDHEGFIIAASFFATYLTFAGVRRHLNRKPQFNFQPRLMRVLPVEQETIEVVYKDH